MISTFYIGQPIDVSEYNTRWLIRPETVIPEIEVETSR